MKNALAKYGSLLVALLSALAVAGAFFVNARAQEKANEAVAPVEKRVTELEKQTAAQAEVNKAILASLEDIKREQGIQREDTKEILRHQRNGK